MLLLHTCLLDLTKPLRLQLDPEFLADNVGCGHAAACQMLNEKVGREDQVFLGMCSGAGPPPSQKKLSNRIDAATFDQLLHHG